MPFGIDDAIGIASIAGGLFGGKKKGSGVSSTPTGFQSWPKEVQDMWLKDVIGGAKDVTVDKPFQPLPMTRVGKPSTMFDSEQLYNWQQLGMFSPMNPSAVKEEAPAITMPPAAPSFTPQDEVFIKQFESGQIPQKQFQMQYNDAIKRRAEAGKVPLPMGGYAPSNKTTSAQQTPTISPEIITKIMQVLGANKAA